VGFCGRSAANPTNSCELFGDLDGGSSRHQSLFCWRSLRKPPDGWEKLGDSGLGREIWSTRGHRKHTRWRNVWFSRKGPPGRRARGYPTVPTMAAVSNLKLLGSGLANLFFFWGSGTNRFMLGPGGMPIAIEAVPRLESFAVTFSHDIPGLSRRHQKNRCLIRGSEKRPPGTAVCGGGGSAGGFEKRGRARGTSLRGHGGGAPPQKPQNTGGEIRFFGPSARDSCPFFVSRGAAWGQSGRAGQPVLFTEFERLVATPGRRDPRGGERWAGTRFAGEIFPGGVQKTKDSKEGGLRSDARIRRNAFGTLYRSLFRRPFSNSGCGLQEIGYRGTGQNPPEVSDA